MKPITLAELVSARIIAKRIEDEAIKERRLLDAQIAELMRDANKPEGAISQRLDGYKVTVTYKLERKVDAKKLTDNWGKLPIDVQAAFKWKPDLSVTEFRTLDDVAKLRASQFFETKPASPSITIEAI